MNIFLYSMFFCYICIYQKKNNIMIKSFKLDNAHIAELNKILRATINDSNTDTAEARHLEFIFNNTDTINHEFNILEYELFEKYDQAYIDNWLNTVVATNIVEGKLYTINGYDGVHRVTKKEQGNIFFTNIVTGESTFVEGNYSGWFIEIIL